MNLNSPTQAANGSGQRFLEFEVEKVFRLTKHFGLEGEFETMDLKTIEDYTLTEGLCQLMTKLELVLLRSVLL